MNPHEQSPLSEILFGAFDFETTGMDPLNDKIVEIGGVFFRGPNVESEYQSLINPGIPISKEAYEVNGIGEALLESAPKLGEVLPEFLLQLASTVPVAHNASFDMSFLMEGARQESLPFLPSPMVDTCIISRKLFPKLKSHKLQTLVTEFALEGDEGHRALSDARSCFSLFCRQVSELPMKWDTPWGEFQSRVPGVFSIEQDRIRLPEKFSEFGPAIHDRKRLLLSYRDGKGARTERAVTPLGLVLDERERVVILGYCHLRRGTRTFRFDRILDMQVA